MVSKSLYYEEGFNNTPIIILECLQYKLPWALWINLAKKIYEIFGRFLSGSANFNLVNFEARPCL